MTHAADDSIAPKPSALRALQNQSWTVHGALAELVDNALGAGRGNATNVVIQWEPRTRLMTVIDNGVGMTALKDLFKLGETVGRTSNDIGEYGCGGTMALLYLASHVELFTLRNGQVAKAEMHWNPLFSADDFPSIPTVWKRATERNTPADLYTCQHGTMIRLRILRRRRIGESQIRRELSAHYAPAVREAKTLLWCTDGQEPIPLSDPLEVLSNVIPLDLSVEVESADGIKHLHANGQVGTIQDLPIERARVALSFGHRVIKWTRDCYSHSDGRRYRANNVCGWIHLADSWQGLYSTTKDDIDDAEAYKALMDAIFERIEPLLKRCAEEKRYLVLEGICLELKAMFENGEQTATPYGDAADDGDIEGPPELEGTIGPGPGPGPGPAVNPAHRRTRRQPGARPGGRLLGGSKLELIDSTNAEMHGCLSKAEVVYRNDGSTTVDVYINKDHRVVEIASEQEPANRMALALVVAQAIAPQIVIHSDIVRDWFSPRIAKYIEDELQPTEHAPFILRLLMDRIRFDRNATHA